MAKDLKVANSTPSKVRVKVGSGDFAEANLVRVNGSDYVWARPLSGTVYVSADRNLNSITVSIQHMTGASDSATIIGSTSQVLTSYCKYKDTLSLSAWTKFSYSDPQESQNVPITSESQDVPELYSSTTEARDPGEQEANALPRYYWQNQSEPVSDWTETVTTTINFNVNSRAGGHDLGSVPSQQSGPSRTIRHVTTKNRENYMKQPQKAHQTRTVTANLVKYKIYHQTRTQYQTQVRTRTHYFTFDCWRYRTNPSADWTTASSSTLTLTLDGAAASYLEIQTSVIETILGDWQNSGDPWWGNWGTTSTTISDWQLNPDTPYTYGDWTTQYTYDYGRPSYEKEGEWSLSSTDTPSAWSAYYLPSATPNGKDEINYDLSPATHEWYTFDYWMQGSTTGAAYSPGQQYADDSTTFYAHWTHHWEVSSS